MSQARHVRRKQLHQYLSGSLLRRERTTSGAKRRPEPSRPPAPTKKTKRLSESSVSDASSSSDIPAA